MTQALRVTVVYSPGPREVREWSLCLEEGATVRDALQASGLGVAFPGIDLSRSDVGVWGRKAAPGQLLRSGDRVELYRALQVDPKLARRERFRKQGSRAAGLFAARRGTQAR